MKIKYFLVLVSVLCIVVFISCSQSDTYEDTPTENIKPIETVAGKRYLISNSDADLLKFYNYFSQDNLTLSDISGRKCYFISRFFKSDYADTPGYREFYMYVTMYNLDNIWDDINVLVQGWYKEYANDNDLLLYITEIKKNNIIVFSNDGKMNGNVGENGERLEKTKIELLTSSACITINNVKYNFNICNEASIKIKDDADLSPLWFSAMD